MRRGELRLVKQPPLLALGPVKVHRHSLQSYGTLIAVFEAALLAMLVTSANSVAAIVTVRHLWGLASLRNGICTSPGSNACHDKAGAPCRPDPEKVPRPQSWLRDEKSSQLPALGCDASGDRSRISNP